MASRKEQKEKLRQERLERERAAATAAARRRRMGYVIAGALVTAAVVAVVAIAFASGGSNSGGNASSSGSWPSGSIPKQKIGDLNAAVKAAGCTYQTPKNEGRGHTSSPNTRVNYKSHPPTSGMHWAIPTHDGAYTKAPYPYEGRHRAHASGTAVVGSRSWIKAGLPVEDPGRQGAGGVCR